MAAHEAVPEPASCPDPATTNHVTCNPSFTELRELSTDDETTTAYGSPSHASEHRSRGVNAADAPRIRVHPECVYSERIHPSATTPSSFCGCEQLTITNLQS